MQLQKLDTYKQLDYKFYNYLLQCKPTQCLTQSHQQKGRKNPRTPNSRANYLLNKLLMVAHGNGE